MVHGIVLHLRIYPAFACVSKIVGLVRVVYIPYRRHKNHIFPGISGMRLSIKFAKVSLQWPHYKVKPGLRVPASHRHLSISNALQTIGIFGFTLLGRTSHSSMRFTALS